MIRFIFAGRLSKEKGFAEVLELCDYLHHRRKDCHIDIFGDGDMRYVLEESLDDWEHVVYHGHQKKEQVLNVWKDCDYTLMPSHFLETFGLVALDSFQFGIPIIAYQKGGLVQFGDGVIAIDKTGLVHTVQKLLKDHSSVSKYYDICISVFRRYHWKRWLSQFQSLSGLLPGSSILIVNDYAVDIGGLENRLSLMTKKLIQEGYHVTRYGKAQKAYGMSRFGDLLKTIGNIKAYWNIKKIIQTKKPQLIWYHSVHRRLGWLPLLAGSRHIERRIMFHDFGMIHPYPSRVFDEQQLLFDNSFRSFWHAAKQRRYMMPLLFAKRSLLQLIRLIITKTVSRFFVPSTYMEDIFGKKLQKDVQAFPLFV